MTFSRSLISVSLVCLLPLAAQAADPAAAPVAAITAPVKALGTPVTREELPALVKQTLIDNPEILVEAAQKMRAKQQADADAKAKTAIKDNAAELFNSPDSPSVGPADADVTVVEFFDYHCGYCKHLLPTLVQILGEDKKVRFVFKEFPILSEDSATAARAAIAVHRLAKDKYFEFHSILMKHDGKYDEKFLLNTAKKMGISNDKMKAEMAKPEVTAILDKDRALGEKIGVRGTPALVIKDTLLPGALSYDELKGTIAAVRAGRPLRMTDEGLSDVKKPEVAPSAAVPAAAPAAKAN